MKINLKSILLLSGLLLEIHIALGQSLKDEYKHALSKEQQERDAAEIERKKNYQEGADLARKIYAQNKLLVCDRDLKYFNDFLKLSTADKAEYLLNNKVNQYIIYYKDNPLIGSVNTSINDYTSSSTNDDKQFITFVDGYLVFLEMSLSKYNSFKGYQGSRLLDIYKMSYVKGRKKIEIKQNYETKPATYDFTDWIRLDSSRVMKWSEEEHELEYKNSKLISSTITKSSFEIRPDELVIYQKYQTLKLPAKGHDDGYTQFTKRDCTWIDFYFNKID